MWRGAIGLGRGWLVAAALAMCVIATGAFLMGSQTTQTPARGTSTATYGLASDQTIVDQGRGISLTLSVDPGSGSDGTLFHVNVTAANLLGAQNNVTGVDDYHGVQVNPPCNASPVTFELLRGYYTAGNFTSGKPVNIHGVQNMMCMVPANALRYYDFQPKSDLFSGPANQGSNLVTRPATAAADISQVWSDNFNDPTSLSPGTYTVVGADNWGQVAAVHFEVTG